MKRAIHYICLKDLKCMLKIGYIQMSRNPKMLFKSLIAVILWLLEDMDFNLDNPPELAYKLIR